MIHKAADGIRGMCNWTVNSQLTADAIGGFIYIYSLAPLGSRNLPAAIVAIIAERPAIIQLSGQLLR